MKRYLIFSLFIVLFLSCSKDNGINNTSIATNVSLLDEKKSREILEAGIGLVIMSIDSLKKEVFEKIRVRLNFEEVRDNAIKFFELRDKINYFKFYNYGVNNKY